MTGQNLAAGCQLPGARASARFTGDGAGDFRAGLVVRWLKRRERRAPESVSCEKNFKL